MEKKKHAGGRPVGSKTLTKAQKQRKLADENSEKKGMRKLTDNQLRAAQLWVYGKEDGTAITTKKELSDLLGISYSVVHGYFSTEWFLAEIDRLQKEQARENKQQVARYVPEAIDAIVACMRDPETNARERITAAKTILDIAGMNDKTVNVNVGGEIGVVRGGFGRDVIEDATRAVVEVTDYEIVDTEEESEEVSVNDLL